MAELPRYRKAGVLLADVPRIDFAGQRSSAEFSGMLAKNLDRMSQWAFGEAADRAKEEGLQYGAENPVTQKQLLDAITAGEDPNKLFQKKNTIFGDAARLSQVASLTSEIEMTAQQQINMLKLGVERGEVDLPKAQSEIQAILDGYGKSLVNVDPKASLKLRASLATNANAAYLSMTRSHFKRQDDLKKQAVDQWIDVTLPDQIRTIIEAGDTVDPTTGGKITVQQRIDATVRQTLLNNLNTITDPVFARQAMVRYDKIVSDARVDALANIANDPEFGRDLITGRFSYIQAIRRIDAGDYGPYSSVYAAMPEQEKAKVRQAVRQSNADRWTAEQHDQAAQKNSDTLEVNGLVTEFITAGPARSREIRSRLNQISVTSGAITGKAINELVKQKSAGEGAANPRSEFLLRSEIFSGRIRSPEQVWERGSAMGLPGKKINEALGFFITRDNRSVSESERIIMNAARIVPNTINPSAARAESYSSMSRQVDVEYSRQMDAHRADPKNNMPPDRAQIAEGVVKKRAESGPQKMIENNIGALNLSYGVNGSIKKTGITFTEDMTLQDVMDALVRDGVIGKNKVVPSDIKQAFDAIERSRRRLNSMRD
jgi:hypothetical protein